jgi:hypothetical protein
MEGPDILAASLSSPEVPDKYGNRWQYYGRSDRHSKVACWAILFDLLSTSRALRDQTSRNVVSFGINHEMRDFQTNRKKNLDLVICTPRDRELKHGFKELVAKWRIAPSPAQEAALGSLPDVGIGPVGAVHVALEAKACMTEHVKARPRLYDELNSSHLTIHGASDIAIAVGLCVVNVAERFISPDLNKRDLHAEAPRVTLHSQPRVAMSVLQKLEEIPRRTSPRSEGFDAFGVILVNCSNDGSPVHIVSSPPAPDQSSIFHYDQMIRRMAQLYEEKFRHL